VMAMGKDRRVRRYTTSRGFWGRESAPHQEAETKQQHECRSYAERVAECGNSINLVLESEEFSLESGELRQRRSWVCEIELIAGVIAELPLLGCEKTRGMLAARSARDAVQELAVKLKREATVIRSGVLFGGQINDEFDD
jgi:hypothetical protein